MQLRGCALRGCAAPAAPRRAAAPALRCAPARAGRRCAAAAAAAAAGTRARQGGGSGVVERPAIAKPPPGRESEFDLDKKKSRQTQMPPNYRVLLHNDAVNKREYVVQVLLKVVEGMSLERAYDIMSEAHQYGLALVLITVQEEAESICESLRNNGLVSTVEPDSGGRRGGGDGGGGDAP